MTQTHLSDATLLTPAQLARALARKWCHWTDCSYQPVVHTLWGRGFITAIKNHPHDGLRIIVRFSEGVGDKPFHEQGLLNPRFFTSIGVPPAVYAAIIGREQLQAISQDAQQHTEEPRKQPEVAKTETSTPTIQPAVHSAPTSNPTAELRQLLTKYGITCLYYMAYVDNVPSILHRGILSHNAAQHIRHIDFSLPAIQDKRATRVIPGSTLTVHDYANLYFATHTPTQWVITHQNSWDLPPLALSELVFIEVDPIKAFSEPGVVFSDGNAGRYLTRFYSDLSDLDKLQWAIIRQHKVWSSDDKRFKCAEVLIPGCVPPKWFKRVVIYDSNTAARMDQLLRVYNILNRTTVGIKCAYEYDQSLYH